MQHSTLCYDINPKLTNLSTQNIYNGTKTNHISKYERQEHSIRPHYYNTLESTVQCIKDITKIGLNSMG